MLVGFHVVNVPRMGAEGADEDAGFELEKVDVVVLTCSDNKST